MNTKKLEVNSTNAPLFVHAYEIEARDQLRLLLLRAIRHGIVSQSEIESLSKNGDQSLNSESESLLIRVVSDLGARIECSDYVVNDDASINPNESPDETVSIDEALEFIDETLSNSNSPKNIYAKSVTRSRLITASDEITLSKSLEGYLNSALDALASWPLGIKKTLAAGQVVTSKLQPLRWFSRHKNDGSTNDVLVKLTSSLDELSKLPLCLDKNDSGWMDVRSALSTLKLSTRFLFELSDCKVYSGASDEYSNAIAGYLASREQMFLANLRLVRYFAGKQNSSDETQNDLIQEGNIGLLKAIENYDWRRGVKFSTYASYFILRYIDLHIKNKGTVIHVPLLVQDKYIEENGLKINFEIHQINHESSDDLIYEDQPNLILPDHFDAVYKSELHSIVNQALQTLDHREEEIIRMRYGVDTDDCMTLEDIGNVLRLTRQRVHQIENIAIVKIRKFGVLNNVAIDLYGKIPDNSTHETQSEKAHRLTIEKARLKKERKEAAALQNRLERENALNEKLSVARASEFAKKLAREIRAAKVQQFMEAKALHVKERIAKRKAKTLNSTKSVEFKKALKEVVATMKANGLTIDDLYSSNYRNHQGQTWNGIGKKPKWLVNAMRFGFKCEDYLVREIGS